MTGARRILSWTLLGVLVLGPLGYGLARLAQMNARVAVQRETEELAAEIARLRAARLPALQAEAGRASRAPAAAARDWRADSHDRAALDMLETVRALCAEAGLTLERIAPASSGQDSARIALTLRARGPLEALQLALYRLETASPRIVVETLRLVPGLGGGGQEVSQAGAGGDGAADLDVTLSLVGAFESRGQ